MQRAISTEHLADFAQHAVNSIRRLMSSSNFDSMSPTQQDLSSTTKQIDDSCNKKHGSKLDATVLELYSKSFADELDHLLDVPTAQGASTSSADAAPVTSRAAMHTTHKPITDALLLQAIESLRLVSRTFGQKGLESFKSAQLLEKLLKWFLTNPTLPKKINDAITSVLGEVLGELPGALTVVMGGFHDALHESRRVEDWITPQHLRCVYFLIATIRRSDLAPLIAPAEQSRNRPFERELVELLMGHIRELRIAHKSAHPTAQDGKLLTAAIMSLVLVHCLIRGSIELKRLVFSHKDIRFLWAFAASNCAKMDVIVTFAAPVGNHSTRTEERAISFDSVSSWAGEIAEMAIELCTSDSFSLRRQSLNSTEAASPSTPPSVRTGIPSGRDRLLEGGVTGGARRWEPLPATWDVTLTTGASAVWRLASILTSCKLSPESVKPLLSFLGSLDTTSNPVTEYIYRCVCSSLLLLCNANPSNVCVLTEAGTLSMLLELLTEPGRTVFPKRQEESPLVAPGSFEGSLFDDDAVSRLSEPSRQLTLSMMSILVSQHFKSDELSLFMVAVETMRQRATTHDDCEVIEHMLHTVGSTLYPRQLLHYGGDAYASCPVDRFAGRWYGYSFTAWINPLCVWSEGCALYSYADPSTPSTVVICLVANGRSRSLAVRTHSNKDFSIALVPDTALSPDTWNHIAVVHNISGFSVYINGRKTTNSVNPPFPKEPSRPHKLQFGLGCDCSVKATPTGTVPAIQSSASAGAPSRVPSFFGFTTCFELLDGALTEKDIERIAAFGPDSHSQSAEPAHALPVFVSVAPSANSDDVEWGGTAIKRDSPLIKLAGIVPHEVPNVPSTFVTLGVVSWAADVLKTVESTNSNRNIIAVLCAEFLSCAFKLASRDDINKYQEMHILEDLRKTLLSWSQCPAALTNSLLSIAIPRGIGKQMRSHPTTSTILNTVLDVLSQPAHHYSHGSSLYSATLKDLSELLSNVDNAKLFKEQSTRFVSLLLISSALPPESVGDFVALIEKLCKEPVELEQLLRFVSLQGPSRQNEMIVCELLRMLFDVARSNTTMCDSIVNTFGGAGVWWLVYLVSGRRHRSEAIRVCATKLLALVLHCSRKGREIYTKGAGFDVLAAAVAGPMHLPTPADNLLASGNEKTNTTTIAALPSAPSTDSAGNPPISVRLMTYNCFFKFALDFYASSQEASGQGALGSNATRHQDPTRSSGSAMFGFHGHLPGVLPPRASRRGLSVDLGYGSECGDVEGRLSVDENYSAQTVSKDLLVHPQAIHIVLLLLGRSIRQLLEDVLTASATHNSEEPSRDGLSEEHHSAATSVTNSKKEDDVIDVAQKVLAYMDRIVDMTPNASALSTHPWLEWLWSAVEPVFLNQEITHSDRHIETSSTSSNTARQIRMSIEPMVRSIIRKVCVVDLSKATKATPFRRVVKEHADEPLLQQLVLEEVVRHFSENNRLDTMEPSEATCCIRNLDALLQGIDEAIVPFPSSLAVEIVFAIRRIAVNNNSWVRLKMKSSTKLFEIRDRLAFTLLTSIREFAKEDDEFLRSLVDVNIQEVNAMHVVLKAIVDAVQHRNIEEVETLQGMLRLLYSLEDEQRKTMQRLLDTDSVELLQPREKSLDAATAASATSSGACDLISWCMTNEQKWDGMVQRILRGYRPVESEVRAQSEKREKEKQSKLRNRRTEVEKKNAASLKGSQDLEKIRLDIDGKGLQQFNEMIAESASVRKERDAS